MNSAGPTSPEPDDAGLRAAFAWQRQVDRAEAPAWNPSLLQPAATPAAARSPLGWKVVLPVSFAAAASIALALAVTFFTPQPPVHSLAHELPVLLPPSAERGHLLASLEGASWGAPAGPSSDFLLPTHLTISMP